jgi:hypothetical protein
MYRPEGVAGSMRSCADPEDSVALVNDVPNLPRAVRDIPREPINAQNDYAAQLARLDPLDDAFPARPIEVPTGVVLVVAPGVLGYPNAKLFRVALDLLALLVRGDIAFPAAPADSRDSNVSCNRTLSVRSHLRGDRPYRRLRAPLNCS